MLPATGALVYIAVGVGEGAADNVYNVLRGLTFGNRAGHNAQPLVSEPRWTFGFVVLTTRGLSLLLQELLAPLPQSLSRLRALGSEDESQLAGQSASAARPRGCQAL